MTSGHLRLGGDNMIFDIAGIFLAATLFALSVAGAYRLGERERKKKREKEGVGAKLCDLTVVTYPANVSESY